MKPSRITKLEQRVRSRPCPGCGRPFDPPKSGTSEIDLERLSKAELEELATLMHAVLTPPCPRCGRQGHNLAQATDEQLERTLKILRVLLDREFPVPAIVAGTAE